MKGNVLLNAITLSVVMLLAQTALAETTFITDKVSVELFSSTFQRGVLVTSVNSGTVVEVIETDGDFVKIRTPDGQEGWVHKKYLTTEKPTQVSYLQLMAKHKQLEEELTQLKNQLKNSTEADNKNAVIGKIRSDLSKANKTIYTLKSQLKEKSAALEQNKQKLAALEKQHQASLKELQAAKTETATQSEKEPESPEAKPEAKPEVKPEATPAPVVTAPVTPHHMQQAFGLDYPIALKWLLVTALLSILLGSYLGYHWLDSKIRRRHGGVRIR